MPDFTQYRNWLFAFALLLTTPAMAVTLQCADEDAMESCTPLVIWTMFQRDFREGEEGWIDDHLSPDEQAALWAHLETAAESTAVSSAWEMKLPPAAAIVLQLLTGKLSAPAAADAARRLESADDRSAVLTTLTLLAHDSELAAAMTWTLSKPQERAVALDWMLAAGSTDAQDWAVNRLLRCSRDQTAGCADDLPEQYLMHPDQLPGIWPRLTPEYRVALLARMPLDELESFLRRELLSEESGDSLYRAWDLVSQSQRPYQHADTFLASLIMERLLDPRVGQEPRFQRPIEAPAPADLAPTLDDLEVRAFSRLLNTGSAESLELWRAQSRSANPWVALMGVAALVANDREREVADQFAAMLDAQGAPPPAMLKLLEHVDTATVDRLYQRMLSKPPGDIRSACDAITGITGWRAKRLASDLSRWAQAALSTVPASEMPPLESIKLRTSPDSYSEPMRSVACVTGAVMRVSKEKAAELEPLASYLATHDSLVYQFIGAVLSLQWDELAPMERFLDSLSTTTNPALSKVHRELAANFAGLRRIQDIKGTGLPAVKASCEYEMERHGIDMEFVVPAPWSVEQKGPTQQRLTLSTTMLDGDSLSVICEVESGPPPRVVFFEFPL